MSVNSWLSTGHLARQMVSYADIWDSSLETVGKRAGNSKKFFAKFYQCGSQANFKQIGSTNHLVNQTRAEASLEKSNNVFCTEKSKSRFSHWLSHLNHTHSCQKLLIDWNMARWITSWIQQPCEVTASCLPQPQHLKWCVPIKLWSDYNIDVQSDHYVIQGNWASKLEMHLDRSSF